MPYVAFVISYSLGRGAAWTEIANSDAARVRISRARFMVLQLSKCMLELEFVCLRQFVAALESSRSAEALSGNCIATGNPAGSFLCRRASVRPYWQTIRRS
jgi:hypothetical protein